MRWTCRRRTGATLLAFLAPWGAAGATLAAEALPGFEADVLIEIENDAVVQSDDPDGEINDLYTTIEPYLTFRPMDGLALEASLVFEPVLDPGPNEDRAFEDQGLFVEELLLRAALGPVEIYGGKFNPPFGTAWDVAPGIYGVDFAEDYEVTEKIGLGGASVMGTAQDGHRVSANVFFADTSVLSESAFENRGRRRETDGGVANTGGLNSVTVSLDGPLGGPFSYHLAYRHLARGVTETHDENGFAAAFHGEHPLSERLSLAPVFEIVHLAHADGLDQDRTYVTAGLGLIRGPWNLRLSYTLRETTTADPGLVESTDDLFQVSAGYAFENGFSIDVAYRWSEEAERQTQTVGLLLAYAFAFDWP